MALVVNLPPGMRAQMDREKTRFEQMQSPDPVTRYRAKEAALSDGMDALTSGLLKQAQAAGKEYERLKQMEADFNRDPFKGKYPTFKGKP